MDCRSHLVGAAHFPPDLLNLPARLAVRIANQFLANAMQRGSTVTHSSAPPQLLHHRFFHRHVALPWKSRRFKFTVAQQRRSATVNHLQHRRFFMVLCRELIVLLAVRSCAETN